MATHHLARRGVGEDVVPVKLFDRLRAVVCDREFVAEAVAGWALRARLLKVGGVGARLALDAVNIGAAALLRVVYALLVAGAHAHLVEVLDGAAEGVALPPDAFLVPPVFDDR